MHKGRNQGSVGRAHENLSNKHHRKLLKKIKGLRSTLQIVGGAPNVR